MSKPSLGFVGFLQATGILVYCSFVGWIMVSSHDVFGEVPIFLAPVAFFLLFMVSAVICALLYLGYPFFIFWEQKQTRKALYLVIHTTLWCLVFLGIILSSFYFSRL